VVPLVCQEFRRIHDRNPPCVVCLDLKGPITVAVAQWCLRVAASLKVLTVDASEHGPGLLPQVPPLTILSLLLC